MKSVIPGANVKIFGRAIHSLSKIGDELYIEPLEHGLSLRTVNSSRSAYSCFVFAPSFFLHYDDGVAEKTVADGDDDDDDDNVIRCKIGMKSCLTVFRSLSTLEKTVDKCKIHINMPDSRLVFQLYCRHGIVKTYNLAFIESETLQAIFSKDLTPNILTAQSRLLCDAVLNFQTTQEEVSLIVSSDEVCIKNYIEDEPDPTKVIRTQMTLVPEEFDSFQVGVETEVTFCLKELRAILAFSESANMPLSVHFESPGKPIIFCLDSDPSFEANFVLATLADANTQVSCSQHSTQVSTAQKDNSVRNSISKKRHNSSELDNPSSKRQEVDPEANGHSSRRPERQTMQSKPKKQQAMQEVLNDLMDDISHSTNPDGAANTSKSLSSHRLSFQPASPNDDEGDSPVIPVQTEQLMSHVTNQSGYIEEDGREEAEEEVPGTPPKTTQFKSLFFGLSQASTTASQSHNPPDKSSDQLMVLAEDTDEDE